MTKNSMTLGLTATDTPMSLRAGQLAARMLPPLVAPSVAPRLYPYERACKERLKVPVRSVTGSSAVWALADIHAYHFALHRYHDWRLLVVGQCVVERGDLVVEVGANIGTETIGFADLVGPQGKVIAYEPLASNVDALRRMLDAQGARHVELVPMAVADEEGTLAFVPPADERYTGIGHLTAEVDHDAAIDVPVTTLDRHLGPERRPALVSMNVVGAELAVIRGARRTLMKWRPVIVLEANADHAMRVGTSLYQLVCELRYLGYAVRAIRRYGLKRVDTTPDAEPCNWVAVPCERKALLSKISARILRCGLLPPWPGLNPMVHTG